MKTTNYKTRFSRVATLRVSYKNPLLTSKKAYGHDISGEVMGDSTGIANTENQKNLEDTAQPQNQHMTAPNPANLTRDSDADAQFPELKAFKDKRVIWPARSR